jgi:endonuclease/exonuclease/phosphatase family metal-dependent hydrolase
MPNLTMVTWNCQKVVASDQGLARLKQQNYDIIMLQEAPLAFRNTFGTGGTLITDGLYSVITPKDDHQVDSAACRSYLLLRTAAFEEIASVKMNVAAGQTHAQRFPAAAKVKLSEKNLRIVSAHMTSGGGGPGNTDSVISALIDNNDETAFVLGADFNGAFGQYSGKLSLPVGMTQQSSNNPIDGFTKESDEELTLSIQNVQTHPDFNIDNNGCTFGHNRVSDHIPVIADLNYEVTDGE